MHHAAAALPAAEVQESFSFSVAPDEARLGSGAEAGPGPGSVFSRGGVLCGEGSFCFAGMGKARDGGCANDREPLGSREKAGGGTGGGTQQARAFGRPAGGSGARLQAALGGPAGHHSSAAVSGLAGRREPSMRGSSNSLSLQPEGRVRGWERGDGYGDGRGAAGEGARGAGQGGMGRRSTLNASYPSPSVDASYSALLDSKARRRGALMASGVVWARSQVRPACMHACTHCLLDQACE